MKTTSFFLAFVGLFLIPALTLCQPKFNLIGGTHFDFGELYYGTAKKILTIRNDGTDTLVISNLSASCGCTGTLMSNDHVLPNDSGALSITFNTRNISGKAEKAVTLETNDPDHKKVRIIFEATVSGVIDVRPEYLYYQAKLDTPSTQIVTIKNRSKSTLSITSATSTLDNIKLKLAKTKLDPEEETTMTAVVTSNTKGTFRGNVEIKTDSPKVPSVQVRVVGLVIDKPSHGTASH